MVVLRPSIAREDLGKALARGIAHEGKPYDFDFDFRRADRLVCTEVIYRAYDGVGSINIPLVQRAGRPTLSGSDLIQMGIGATNFTPVAVFAPMLSPGIVTGSQARRVLIDGQSR